MVHTGDADDAMFGDQAALTNGLFFMRYNGTKQNYGNYKANGDFRLHGGVVTYTVKGGGGKYSTTALFNINEMYGIVLRIDKEECDEFRCYVRDDLSSLFSIRVSILGQYTQGE